MCPSHWLFKLYYYAVLFLLKKMSEFQISWNQENIRKRSQTIPSGIERDGGEKTNKETILLAQATQSEWDVASAVNSKENFHKGPLYSTKGRLSPGTGSVGGQRPPEWCVEETYVCVWSPRWLSFISSLWKQENRISLWGSIWPTDGERAQPRRHLTLLPSHSHETQTYPVISMELLFRDWVWLE